MTARMIVDCDRHHVGIPVADIPEAIHFYTERLGFETSFTWGDPPTFAGVSLGEAEIFLRKGTPNPAGCSLYFVVGDADELFAFHRDRGVEVVVEPGDREYGIRDYVVKDLHGYHLSFGHYIYTVGPPVPIQRVEVTARLERRLAALLEDLAAHKRMTVGECLEEILLHTNEPMGRRGREPPHAEHPPSHPGAQAEARHRLRRPRELPLRGGGGVGRSHLSSENGGPTLPGPPAVPPHS